MSTVTATFPRNVLADLVVPLSVRSTRLRALAVDSALVIAAATITALATLIVIPVPGSPVPVTGQTFAVLLTAASLGCRRGLAGQCLYIVAGLAGAPIFSAGGHGVDVFFGATGGYLVGFLLAAAIMGAAARVGADRHVLLTATAMVISSAAIYAVGVPWLAVSTGMGIGEAISAGLVPFLMGDALKVALAAAALPTAWKLVSKVTSTP